jgi:hypothetical protein
MMGCELVATVLDDLRKAEKSLQRHGNSDPAAFRYLTANREPLLAMIDLVYSGLDRARRAELLEIHRELDYSAVANEWRQLAVAAVEKGMEWSRAQDANRFMISLKDDELHTLIRALNYAKYVDCSTLEFDLRFSPIEDFGLRHRWGEFAEPLTPEESKAVPWAISDVVLEAQKAITLKCCRELGIDLEPSMITEKPPSQWENLSRALELLADLLKYRAETDIAAVKITQIPLKRCANAIVCRIGAQAGEIRDKLVNALNPSPEEPVLERRHIIEQEIKSLRKVADQLANNLNSLQPRAAVSDGVNNRYHATMNYGDIYNITNPKDSAIGRNARIYHVTVDLEELALQLGKIRKELQDKAGPKPTAEQQSEIDNVVAAENAAKNNKPQSVKEFMKRLGHWTIDAGTAVGAGLAVELIKKAIGL